MIELLHKLQKACIFSFLLYTFCEIFFLTCFHTFSDQSRLIISCRRRDLLQKKQLKMSNLRKGIFMSKSALKLSMITNQQKKF